MSKVNEYSKLSLDELNQKIEENDKVLHKIWEEDDGSSWDNYCKKCGPYWKDNEALYAAASLKQTPKMRPIAEWEKECLIPIKEFEASCKFGAFTDSDGEGCYATETEVSDIEASPNAFVNGNIRTDFSHVCWYNK